MERERAQTVEAYIDQFPPAVRERLEAVRRVIREVAPEAEERLAYGMPGYYLSGPLLYFAAFSRHIGLYPTPEGIAAFREELAPYRSAKGSVQFPLDQPLPLALIREIARSRAEENRKRTREKETKRKEK